MDNKAKLSGLFPPVMTPFREDQTVDLGALRFNIEKMNPTGLIGYMPLGSNGEYRSLSDAEALDVVRVVRESAAPGKIVMAGAARESAYQTTEFIKALADVGIDYASLLSPHYFASKMTRGALRKYFECVADASPVPVLLYCAPKFAANVVITPELAGELAAHPNIVGIKDTSSLDIADFCRAVPRGADFHVLSGSINKYLRGLTLGAVGGVLSPLNYIPEQCVEIERLFRTGKPAEAETLSARIIDFNQRAAGKHGVPGVKAAMDIMGYRGGVPRNPLFPLEKTEIDAMRGVFVKEGFVK